MERRRRRRRFNHKVLRSIMLILNVFLMLSFIFTCFSQTPVTVNTNVGNIMGFQEYVKVDGDQKLITKFLGIPFAESTAGKNRFMKPVPKTRFQSTFDARKAPLACYQRSSEENKMYKNFGVHGFSEDCLTLNIYVPNDFHSRDLLPVMIWFYGGGFSQGAAAIYNPEVFSIFGNVIVVTVNYRIGMFGFLRDSNGIFPGNQGLWDQHLAIKWVHDNIGAFFGYEEVTIFGQSAGGGSVHLQALYPGNKGLFKRFIAESGTALAPWAIEEDMSTFENYFKDQGCPPDTKAFVSCLQTKNPEQLQTNVTTFSPVVDGDFLVDTPREIMEGTAIKTAQAREFFSSLDIIVGINDLDASGIFGYFSGEFGYNQIFNVTRDEFKDQIVPSYVNLTFSSKDNDKKLVLQKVLISEYTRWDDPDNYLKIRDSVLDMVNDGTLFAPTILTADAHAAQQRGKTYLYEFAVQTLIHIIPVVPWLNGSNHGDDILYVFGLILQENVSFYGMDAFNSTADEKQVSRAVMALWSNFAKSGNPNVPMDVTQFTNTTWPEYTTTSQRYFKISNHMSPASILERFHPERMALWSNVIPLILEKQSCPNTQTNIVHFDPSVDLIG